MDSWGLVLAAVVLFFAGGVLVWYWRRRTPAGESPFLLLQQQLDGLRTELRSQAQGQAALLQKSQEGIGHRLDNASKFFGGMESKIVRMEETTKQVLGLGKDIAELQQILRAPKLRGNFSEQLLGDLLSQMLPQDYFILQHTFGNGERVDAVIRTAERLVPIDAKFPLEHFRRLVEAKGEEEKASLRKIFLAGVKKHIDDIADKYILPGEGTFEFALMYIPAENVYYEIITKDISAGENHSLMNHALKRKVIPVSPNTFFAYLQTILLGLQGMQVQKRVKEILTEMGRIRQELVRFQDDFGTLGRHLNNAVSSFGKSEKRLGRLEDRISHLEVAPAPALAEPAASSEELQKNL
ncbi:MAG: DNA recombination protein RmuC [Deltaproteobacteria bacterium]|nr:DNA recombination protein RmuC [Deltaproteobacteria bacterium]